MFDFFFFNVNTRATTITIIMNVAAPAAIGIVNFDGVSVDVAVLVGVTTGGDVATAVAGGVESLVTVSGFSEGSIIVEG